MSVAVRFLNEFDVVEYGIYLDNEGNGDVFTKGNAYNVIGYCWTTGRMGEQFRLECVFDPRTERNVYTLYRKDDETEEYAMYSQIR